MDTDVLFQSFMNHIDIGDGKEAYYDHYCRRNFDVMKYRQMTNLLVVSLLNEGRMDDALKVVQKGLKELPVEVAPEAMGNISFLQLAFEAGLKEEAKERIGFLMQRHLNNLYWYNAQPARLKNMATPLFSEEIDNGRMLNEVLNLIGDEEMLNQFKQTYQELGLARLME